MVAWSEVQICFSLYRIVCDTNDERFNAISTWIKLQWMHRRACRHMQLLQTCVPMPITVICIWATIEYGNNVKLHALWICYRNTQCRWQFIAFYWKLEMRLIWLITGRAQNFNYDISATAGAACRSSSSASSLSLRVGGMHYLLPIAINDVQ